MNCNLLSGFLVSISGIVVPPAAKPGQKIKGLYGVDGVGAATYGRYIRGRVYSSLLVCSVVYFSLGEILVVALGCESRCFDISFR